MRDYNQAEEEQLIALYQLEKEKLAAQRESQEFFVMPKEINEFCTGVAEHPQNPLPGVLQPAAGALPPMSTQGNCYSGRMHGSQDESAASSTQTPIKQEKLDEVDTQNALEGAVKEEKDVKPPKIWVPFVGGFKEEYEAKWRRDLSVKEEQADSMEVIDNVSFEINEFNT